MKLRITTLIFVSVFHLVVNQECGDNCNTNRECTGDANQKITIPCGIYSEDSEVTFTYRNESVTGNASAKVLLENSTECLVLNLTAYDDNIEISCEPSGANGASFNYDLSVHYSPRILVNTENKFGSFLMEYTLDCPLQSNPPPNCFWEVFYLSYEVTLIDNPFGVHYSGDGGCTLVIESLTLNYTSIIFNCTATNELGSKTFSFNSIDFNTCSQDQTAILSPQPIEGSTLFLSKGQNVTLSCIVTKVSIGTYQAWTINATNNTSDNYIVGDNYTNDYELCTQTMTLNLQDVSYNDSGTYTCVYYTFSIDPDKRLGNISLNILVVDEEGKLQIPGTHGSDKNVIISTTTIAFVLLIVIASTTTVIVLLCRWKSNHIADGFQFTKLYHTDFDDIDDIEFDIFLSFAEEDREAAENVIKKPLEKMGYNVCWHHDAFVPGFTIDDNMERSIFKSRFIVTLISNAFLHSEFCQTELDITRRRIQQTSRNCLVPIIMDSSCNIPPELRKITYITIDDKAFIKRLLKKLGDPYVPNDNVLAHV